MRPTREVKSGKLELAVSSRGRVESARSVDVYCLVESVRRIITLAPGRDEGQEGRCHRHARLGGPLGPARQPADHDETRRGQLPERQIDAEVAEIAVKEYVEGVYKQDMETLKREVEGFRATIRKIEERLERTRKASRQLEDAFAAGGARTAADIVAQVDIQDRVAEGELALDRERRAVARRRGRWKCSRSTPA